MEIQDSRELVQDIIAQKTDIVTVRIDLPDYLDIVSLLALDKRMSEIARACGVKIRLLGETKNLAVEKALTRLCANRDNIYTTILWKE